MRRIQPVPSVSKQGYQRMSLRHPCTLPLVRQCLQKVTGATRISLTAALTLICFFCTYRIMQSVQMKGITGISLHFGDKLQCSWMLVDPERRLNRPFAWPLFSKWSQSARKRCRSVGVGRTFAGWPPPPRRSHSSRAERSCCTDSMFRWNRTDPVRMCLV